MVSLTVADLTDGRGGNRAVAGLPCILGRMRISREQIETIRTLTREIAGPDACVRLFGSRLDDAACGGDVDLLVEIDRPVENPALLGARMAAKISRAFHGRKVDVIISAPNLARLPIHEIAAREGVRL